MPLIILIIIIILLQNTSEEPNCPPLYSETKRIYAEQDSPEYWKWYSEQEQKKVEINGEEYYMVMATSTVMNGKSLTLIGTEPDPEAIEHNKTVRECLKANTK